MTLEKARRVASEFGLELRFDHNGQSWLLGPSRQSSNDECVSITPHVLDDLSPGRFERHYVKEALAHAPGSGVRDED